MKTNKTSSNEELNDKPLTDLEADMQLLPRLRFMGYLLLFFSGCALCYSLFFASDVPSNLAYDLSTDGFTSPEEMEYAAGLSLNENASFTLFQVERYNAYIVTLSFAIVGSICLLSAYQKQKKHPKS